MLHINQVAAEAQLIKESLIAFWRLSFLEMVSIFHLATRIFYKKVVLDSSKS